MISILTAAALLLSASIAGCAPKPPGEAEVVFYDTGKIDTIASDPTQSAITHSIGGCHSNFDPSWDLTNLRYRITAAGATPTLYTITLIADGASILVSPPVEAPYTTFDALGDCGAALTYQIIDITKPGAFVHREQQRKRGG